MLIAVNYHYVRPAFDAPYPGIHGITPEKFETQLKLLASAGTFVGAADVRAAVRGDAPLPDRAFIVTFDDGLREQYEHALPVLRRLGIRAIFFVNTCPVATATVSSVHKTHLLRAHVAPADFMAQLEAAARARQIEWHLDGQAAGAVAHYRYDDPDTARLKFLLNFVLNPADRDVLIDMLFESVFGKDETQMSRRLYLDRSQIGELAETQSIGTHAHEHLPLGLMSEEAARGQLADSMNLLAAWTGERPFVLSYPYGSREACSPAVAAEAAQMGIEFAFTMERAGNPHLRRPLHLARFDNNDMPGGKAARWKIDELFAAVTPRTWYLD